MENYYIYNENGIFSGQAPGIRDPRTKQIVPPSRSTKTPPPSPPEGKLVKWTGADWSLIDDPKYLEEQKKLAEQEHEENLAKLRNDPEIGVALFRLNELGEIVPKTPDEVRADQIKHKRNIVSSVAHLQLQFNFLAILRELAKTNPKVTKYLDELNAIINGADIDTEVESIKWPKFGE